MVPMRRLAAVILPGLIGMSLAGCYQVSAPPPPPGGPPPAAAEPREGFWDRDHNRWFHEHTWHQCDDHDPHCR